MSDPLVEKVFDMVCKDLASKDWPIEEVRVSLRSMDYLIKKAVHCTVEALKPIPVVPHPEPSHPGQHVDVYC